MILIHQTERDLLPLIYEIDNNDHHHDSLLIETRLLLTTMTATYNDDCYLQRRLLPLLIVLLLHRLLLLLSVLSVSFTYQVLAFDSTSIQLLYRVLIIFDNDSPGNNNDYVMSIVMLL